MVLSVRSTVRRRCKRKIKRLLCPLRGHSDKSAKAWHSARPGAVRLPRLGLYGRRWLGWARVPSCCGVTLTESAALSVCPENWSNPTLYSTMRTVRWIRKKPIVENCLAQTVKPYRCFQIFNDVISHIFENKSQGLLRVVNRG